MAFHIEIITTKKNLLPFIKDAIAPLNKVQKEFVFDIATERLLAWTALYDQENYITNDVFSWMPTYRTFAGGHKPFVILVIDKPLSGKQNNLFGSHNAKEGFAVFTTNSFDPKYQQYLFDIVRFCRYYFIRYTLSFVNPDIKSHPSVGCMFDNKTYKPDLLLSLSTGNICVDCQKQMIPKYNEEIKPAIDSLLLVVSNQIPVSLVVKGGGVKGLAFAGALLELGKYYTFDVYAGTSAGAITATLLGVGYSPQELLEILNKTDFNKFKDSNFLSGLWNLYTKGGYHSGRAFKEWLNNLLKQKLPHKVSEIAMQDLPTRTIVYASRQGDGVLRFDSKGTRKEQYATFATRCSMSIPLFFVPETIDGHTVYDGGLGNNFPLRTFMSDNAQNLFLGLYLMSETSEYNHFSKKMMDIVTDQDERQVVDDHRSSIVVINPTPIGTTEFNLNEERKLFLVNCGRLGAMQYLRDFRKDIDIDTTELTELMSKVNLDRQKIISENEERKNN